MRIVGRETYEFCQKSFLVQGVTGSCALGTGMIKMFLYDYMLFDKIN